MRKDFKVYLVVILFTFPMMINFAVDADTPLETNLRIPSRTDILMSPIQLNSDQDLINLVDLYGFPGSGTLEDPYLISDTSVRWENGENAIHVENEILELLARPHISTPFAGQRAVFDDPGVSRGLAVVRAAADPVLQVLAVEQHHPAFLGVDFWMSPGEG